MCAILGISFLKGSTMRDSARVRLILRNLLALSQDRGRRATGIAAINGQEINVLKKDVSASKFIIHPDYIRFTEDYIDVSEEAMNKGEQTLTILGHCRLDTKGTPTNNDNNHPIVTENVVGVHNGVISNDDALFERFEKNITRKAQVDSEIIFRMIDYYIKNRKEAGYISQAVKDTYKYLTGSFSCGLVSRTNPYTLHLFKGYNPCEVLVFEDNGMVIFSSNSNYIRKATDSLNLGSVRHIPFDNECGMTINLISHKKYTYPLSD